MGTLYNGGGGPLNLCRAALMHRAQGPGPLSHSDGQEGAGVDEPGEEVAESCSVVLPGRPELG